MAYNSAYQRQRYHPRRQRQIPIAYENPPKIPISRPTRQIMSSPSSCLPNNRNQLRRPPLRNNRIPTMRRRQMYGTIHLRPMDVMMNVNPSLFDIDYDDDGAPMVLVGTLSSENVDFETILQQLFDAQRPNQVPAKEESFKKMPVTTFETKNSSDKENNKCCICYDNYELSDKIVTLMPCKHYFHVDCAATWLTKHNNACPLCRKPIST